MIRYLIGKGLTLLAIASIVAAVLMTVIRLLLPYIDLYQQDIQRWLGNALDQPLHIKSLEAEWHGLGPLLRLHDIAFLDPHGGVRASLAEASIAVDVPRSLLNGKLILGSLTVSGVSLSVIHHRDGSVAIAGLGAVGDRSKVAADSGGTGAMLAWLFSQEHLALENSTIHWYDERFSQQDLRFVNVNLELQNDDERHQFDGSASLPDNLGRRFSFAIDLLGDIFVAGGWSGHAYVNGAGLQTASLLNWLPLPGIRVDNGIAELRLWTEWQASHLQQLDGEVSIFGLQLSSVPAEAYPALRTELLDSVSGRFHWQRHADGWQFDVNRFILGRHGQFWPQSNYHVAWSDPAAGNVMHGESPADESLTAEMAEAVSAASADSDNSDSGASADGFLQLSADYLRLDDVLALLQLSDVAMPAVRDRLTNLQPSGELRNLRLQWHADSTRIAIDSEISAISLHPWQKFPGISGLSGRVIADNHGGRLELDSRSLEFDSRPLFRQKLAIEALKGLVYWQHADAGWHWSGRDLSVATADASVDADIDLDIPADGGTPYLDLVAGFASRPHGISNVSTYLPVGIMHEKTVKWLDQALVNGTISNGGLVMQGPLNHFPYDHPDGRFEVRFVVEDGILDYAADWPRLDELETEIVFSGRRMNINAVAGKLLGADLDVVHASIDDLKAKPAQLRIVGDVNGTTADVLKFLQISPLREHYGHYVDNVQGDGRSRVDIDLLLPLAAGHKDSIDGAVTLQDSGLTLADGAVNLTDLNGRVGFSNRGLQADDITGKVMGLAARFAVATADDDVRVTTVSATGNAAIDEIRTIIDPPLFDQFSGRSDWRARLRIPGKNSTGSTLQISSDLRGLATNLPPPLAKPADQALHLVAEMDFPAALDRPVTVQLDDDISMILDLDDKLHMQRGEIRFADGPAKLPPISGMRIAGVFPQFSFSEWIPILKHAAATAAATTATAETTNADGVNQVDVAVADVELFRRHFTNARIHALWQGGSWQTQVDSEQLKGNAQVPIDAETPLIMDMERMDLSSSAAGEAAEDDPRDWPPLHIQSRSFIYDGIDFGSLLVNASRGPAGLHMNELQLHSPDMGVQAHGDWLYANDKQFSSFTISFDSSDVGKSLSRLGYADTIKGGKGNFVINARWPGEPLAFALARLDGNMHLRIDNGRLLDVDPGVGRIFGLLSLQALPRRLILDFRDVFSKGFAFDKISGDFDVKNGQATTSNLIMKGPSAKIAAEGRVGLAEHDYDQLVTVVPDVAGTVPMITALTQGAGVGAVVLLLKKLLEPELDKVSMILYKVTGSWDDPQITRMENPEQLKADQQGGRATDGATKKAEKK